MTKELSDVELANNAEYIQGCTDARNGTFMTDIVQTLVGGSEIYNSGYVKGLEERAHDNRW